MRKILLLFLFMAGCGTSDPLTWKECPGCAAAGGTWNLIADGAEIRGDYDVVGPPDPYLCATIKGTTRCTSSQSDTSSPRWSETLFEGLATADLTNIPVALWDKDTGGLDSDDFICSTTVSLTADQLEQGGYRFDCSAGDAAFLFHHVQ